MLIPTGFILLMVVAVLAAILLNKTKPGRYIVSLGSNYEATRLSGVNVAKYRTLAYIISGTLAGLAGLAYAAIYSTILPRRRCRYGTGCHRRRSYRWNLHEWWILEQFQEP